jgi:hypothetical protein
MDAAINIGSVWGTGHEVRSFLSKLFTADGTGSKKIATPRIIAEKCNGVTMGGQSIRSLIFSTDMALIENNDSDAVLAVYPFAPSVKIMKALIEFSEKPVICGVGGGLTQGRTSLDMAMAAEDMGAVAIIVNQPFKNRHIETIRRRVNIPIVSACQWRTSPSGTG